MPREILCRGIVKYNGNHFFNGEMVFGSLIKKSSGIFIYVIEEDNLGNIHSESEVEVIPESIGQFTGLTDKNGVKIFENDIVKAHGRLFKEGFTLKNVVVLEDGLFQLKGTGTTINGGGKITEVIGNIFENPELL